MQGILIVILCGIPFVCIGIGVGLVIARAFYLPTIRWQKRCIDRSNRNMALFTQIAARMGYQRGMNEAERNR